MAKEEKMTATKGRNHYSVRAEVLEQVNKPCTDMADLLDIDISGRIMLDKDKLVVTLRSSSWSDI